MALRFFSRRPLTERLQTMRRQYRFVSWLMCVVTLASILGSVYLGHEGRTVLMWCLFGVGMVWVDMSIVIVIWSAFLWARGVIRRGRAWPPVLPRPVVGADMNDWFDCDLGREASQSMLYEARGGVPALWRENEDFPNSPGGRAEVR